MQILAEWSVTTRAVGLAASSRVWQEPPARRPAHPPAQLRVPRIGDREAQPPEAPRHEGVPSLREGHDGGFRGAHACLHSSAASDVSTAVSKASPCPATIRRNTPPRKAWASQGTVTSGQLTHGQGVGAQRATWERLVWVGALLEPRLTALDDLCSTSPHIHLVSAQPVAGPRRRQRLEKADRKNEADATEGHRAFPFLLTQCLIVLEALLAQSLRTRTQAVHRSGSTSGRKAARSKQESVFVFSLREAPPASSLTMPPSSSGCSCDSVIHITPPRQVLIARRTHLNAAAAALGCPTVRRLHGPGLAAAVP
jgi:hypothetical protein